MATLDAQRSAPRPTEGGYSNGAGDQLLDTLGWCRLRIERILLFTARVFLLFAVVRISDSVGLLCDRSGLICAVLTTCVHATEQILVSVFVVFFFRSRSSDSNR